MQERPDERPDGGAVDADLAGQEERARGDPAVVHERGQAVPDEPLLGDEDLAKYDRDREDHRRHAHEAEERHVEVTLVALEPRHDEVDGLRREDEEDDADRGHQDDGIGQDRPAEGHSVTCRLVPEGREQRHERRDQPSGDQDVEGQLRQDEGGIVGVKARAGPVRPCEGPVPHHAHGVCRERQQRQNDGAARQEGPGRDPDTPPCAARPTHRRILGGPPVQSSHRLLSAAPRGWVSSSDDRRFLGVRCY